ncbi:diguanylate cyclase [Acaryochloris sp. IP29b_bin.148]|uniref:diguanylate cyclase domain-containing protein n=1 Tax=Acaryochloris sp. IP29b_bin.148 TaxID=2969218 RepID=UPI002613CE9E|nr:diguanylate cyclase [Acaryochloris sp. IP29b_bin.148]
MSFIPPFFSDDLSEPTELVDPSAQPKSSFINHFAHQLRRRLQPIGLYQRIGFFWMHQNLSQVALRSHFETRLEKEWQRLRQERQPLSLFLCEVDDFANIRRQYGDLACNTYVSQVVKILHANLERSSKGMLARYQGDTFAVLLPKNSLDEAACIAKKIRLRVKALNDSPILPQSTPDCRITLSLGIATIVPTPKLAPENLIAAAEQSLRQAQRAGGNRIVLQEGSR